jgi:RNA polymerase sigma factor (TIGR02999 family)
MTQVNGRLVPGILPAGPTVAMEPPTPGDVTRLLIEWKHGDAAALDRVLPLIYAELRRIASRHLRRERPGHTLQPTALVHEAYLKLVQATELDWRDRAHFFAVAARVMRQILVDHARARQAEKRGGAFQKVSIEEVAAPGVTADIDLLALEKALGRLGDFDPQQGRVVELRYFGGLTIEETAEVIGISPATVKREWMMARAWLRRELSGGPD